MGSYDRRQYMRDRGLMNQARGKAEKIGGRIKDAVGALSDDAGLQAQGKIDKMKGRVRDGVGKAQERLSRGRSKRKYE